MSNDLEESASSTEKPVENENPEAGPLEEKTDAQSGWSDLIAFRPESAMMAAIDFEVAEQGMQDRADLVKHAVSEYLGRQKDNRLLLKEDLVHVSATGRKMRMPRAELRANPGEQPDTIPAELARPDGLAVSGQSFESHIYPEKNCRTIFVAEKELLREVYYLHLGETDCKYNPRKTLTLRTFHKYYGAINRTGEDGTWTLGESMTFQRSSLPWLIATLTSAEEALQFEATNNRRQAQEKRAARSEDEVAQEQEIRQRYSEKYSKEQITKAVRLAGSHRSASLRQGLSEHFTWWEWLDLCARTGFRCPTCNEASPLTPHHILARSKGGANTINNIAPVCQRCHPHIEGMVDGREQWLAEQLAMAELFKVGDLVQRLPYYWNRFDKEPHSGKAPGHVIDIIKPSSGDGPLWVPNGGHCYTYFHSTFRFESLVSAAVIVRWTDAASTIEEVQPGHLRSFDGQAWNEEQRDWLAEQQRLLERFQLGDVVYRSLPKANTDVRGRIMNLISPVPGPPWGVQADGSFGFVNDNPLKESKAKARVQWIKNGSTNSSVVFLEFLAKLSEEE